MYDTLIIGGGVAGLTVAKELAKRGEKVLLLDKWGNWGGRVYTHHEKGYTYEVGAGRIFSKHTHVTNFVKSHKLKMYPISASYDWEDRTPNPFIELFAPIRTLLQKLPEKALRMHTIAQLLPQSMHPLLERFPYTSEFHVLRADEALKFFSPSETMGTSADDDYYGLVDGLEQIPHILAKEAQAAGAKLLQKHKVMDVKQVSDTLFEVEATHDKKPILFNAKRVIFATCRCSLGEFKILKNAPILKQTGTAPLTRMYAVYPPDPLTKKVWFHNLPKIVTSNPLRYVIPINHKSGLIMISYTDGHDTEHWHGLEGKKLQAEIQRCVKELFPERTIPEPTYLNQHRWDGGCTYWLPGDYTIDDAITVAQNPAPNVYICGESISKTQCWIESALESAENLLRILK
jgi:hypothetical protein